MRFYKHITVVLVLVLALVSPKGAFAFEALKFSSTTSSTNALRLGDALKTHMVATADLNEDGIEEFILRQKDCVDNSLCDYKVLARKKSDTTPLGAFKARKVLLGSHYTNGIRNFIVYADASSDFSYSVYAWDKDRSEFVERAE